MARLPNALQTSQAMAGYPAPMANLALGGMDGFAPDMTQWCNHQAYVAQQAVFLHLEGPVGFKYFPDPQFWYSALKSLLETHAKSITGYSAGLEVDFVENSVSGGGEMQQDPINVTRARTNPSFTFVEKYGRPIQTFLYEYITNLIGDPDSKIPNIATLAGPTPTDLMADMYTFSGLLYEADPSNTTIQKAWLSCNMMPKSTGDITAKRELSSAKESGEITIEFTAISTSTLGVRLFAQALLDSINFTNANPNLAPAFIQSIDPSVLAANVGYAVGAQNLGASAVVTRA